MRRLSLRDRDEDPSNPPSASALKVMTSTPIRGAASCTSRNFVVSDLRLSHRSARCASNRRGTRGASFAQDAPAIPFGRAVLHNAPSDMGGKDGYTLQAHGADSSSARDRCRRTGASGGVSEQAHQDYFRFRTRGCRRRHIPDGERSSGRRTSRPNDHNLVGRTFHVRIPKTRGPLCPGKSSASVCRG